METKKVKMLSDQELQKIFGGKVAPGGGTDCVLQPTTDCPRCPTGGDGKDCTSEAASGGGTTDTE
ncbi:MAG: hypothetical protein ABIN36_14600 [Ferruginibacter sp.]